MNNKYFYNYVQITSYNTRIISEEVRYEDFDYIASYIANPHLE